MPRFFITNIDEALKGIRDPKGQKAALRRGIKEITYDLLGVFMDRQEVIFRTDSDPEYTMINVEIHVIPENYNEEDLVKLPGLIQRAIYQTFRGRGSTVPVKAYLVKMVCHTSSKAKEPLLS